MDSEQQFCSCKLSVEILLICWVRGLPWDVMLFIFLCVCFFPFALPHWFCSRTLTRNKEKKSYGLIEWFTLIWKGPCIHVRSRDLLNSSHKVLCSALHSLKTSGNATRTRRLHFVWSWKRWKSSTTWTDNSSDSWRSVQDGWVNVMCTLIDSMIGRVDFTQCTHDSLSALCCTEKQFRMSLVELQSVLSATCAWRFVFFSALKPFRIFFFCSRLKWWHCCKSAAHTPTRRSCEGWSEVWRRLARKLRCCEQRIATWRKPRWVQWTVETDSWYQQSSDPEARDDRLGAKS